jgi:predicted pyridoxine 5'-phosphate oxidase superfamily flavin-nucleotide-binding protein
MSDVTFHAGERRLQEWAGVRDRLAQAGPRVIRDYMPDQHRLFFAELPLLFVGSLDAQGQPWASVLAGPPGFVRSPDPRTLRIDALPAPYDRLSASLKIGAPVGLLGIQLETRRRNRMNGTVTALDARGFTVAVGQSFGNCPQYIQARAWEARPDAAMSEVSPEGPHLSDRAAALIARADTFFIASAAPQAGSDVAHGVDVSHRGGRPGFVRVVRSGGTTRLTIPDFRGNFYFNTLGNIAAYPRTGLLFVDFADGSVLSLTGTGAIDWNGPEVDRFPGAEHLLNIDIEGGRFVRNALKLRWSAPDYAPQLARTGTWNV